MVVLVLNVRVNHLWQCALRKMCMKRYTVYGYALCWWPRVGETILFGPKVSQGQVFAAPCRRSCVADLRPHQGTPWPAQHMRACMGVRVYVYVNVYGCVRVRMLVRVLRA